MTTIGAIRQASRTLAISKGRNVAINIARRARFDRCRHWPPIWWPTPWSPIIALAPPAAVAAKAATATIPIIFRDRADPVGLGLVSSSTVLAACHGRDFVVKHTRGKTLELLRELVPSALLRLPRQSRKSHV